MQKDHEEQSARSKGARLSPLDFRCSSRVALNPHPQKKPCRTCRPSTARGVARHAASEKVSQLQGVLAATLAGVALHCATMSARGARGGRELWRHSEQPSGAHPQPT